jgi:hypothetical protein
MRRLLLPILVVATTSLALAAPAPKDSGKPTGILILDDCDGPRLRRPRK